MNTVVYNRMVFPAREQENFGKTSERFWKEPGNKYIKICRKY